MQENHKKRKRIGVKYKLYSALLVMNILIVLLGLFSWRTFNHIDQATHMMTERMFPVAKISSEITLINSQINNLAPQLIYAESKAELDELYAHIVSVSQNKTQLLEKLSKYTNLDASLGYIEALNKDMDSNLAKLNTLIAEKIRLKTAQTQNLTFLEESHRSFTKAVAPVADDAQFDLVLGLEENNNDHDAQDKLIPIAETLTFVLETKAEGNLLDGILETATFQNEQDALAPLKEKFDATLERLETNLSQLSQSGKDIQSVKEAALVMRSLGVEKNNIFYLQRRLLGTELQLSLRLNLIKDIGIQANFHVEELTQELQERVESVKQATASTVDTTLVAIIAISFACIAFSLLISWLYIGKQVIGRLENLKNVMLSLVNNDFSDTISRENVPDEIGEMASALFVFREKLIENQLLTEDLKITTERAEQANKAKSEFLANMSHELRTPLNSIIGLSEILEEDLKPDTEEHEMVETISKSASTLLTIVNDILDISKIEAGEIVLENIGFDFKETLTRIINSLAHIASSKGISLDYKFEKQDMPFIEGDPTRIGLILTNLIGNALKYTSDGSVNITVNYTTISDDQIEIICKVQDTGIGVSDDKQQVIFNKFSQADESTTRKFGGTGLGLAITKELVELMNGEIGLQSTEGDGSTFWFIIPAKVTGQIHRDEIENTEYTEDHENENKVSVEGASILVAEDYDLNKVFIKKLLKRKGFRKIDFVQNGLEALQSYSKNSYDLILMDCHMPEMNGYQATEEIRNREKESKSERTPIIALTADAMVGVKQKCVDAGMDEYITKPIDPKIFHKVVSQWINFSAAPMEQTQKDPPQQDEEALSLLDMDALDAYTDTPEEKEEFCNLFCKKTEESMLNLKAECTDGENKKWTEIAHQIKGSAGMIGALQLQKLCGDAQKMTVAKKSEREELYDQIETIYHKTKSALKNTTPHSKQSATV